MFHLFRLLFSCPNFRLFIKELYAISFHFEHLAAIRHNSLSLKKHSRG